MRANPWLSAAVVAMLAGCGAEPQAAENAAAPPASSADAIAPEPAAAAPIQPGLAWDSVASGEGTALRLLEPGGSVRMTIACLADPGRLVVTVPSFAPIGSEERFAFALGEEPVTLVADPTDRDGPPGVTGEGPIPANFERLLRAANGIGAHYGSQQLGPHLPPPADLVDLFAVACADARG